MTPHVREGVIRLSFKQVGKCDVGCMSQWNELAGSCEKDVLLAEKQLDRKDDCYAKPNEKPLEKMLCGSFFWSEFLDLWKELARARLEFLCNYLTARIWTTRYTYIRNRVRFRTEKSSHVLVMVVLYGTVTREYCFSPADFEAQLLANCAIRLTVFSCSMVGTGIGSSRYLQHQIRRW